jgi:hypothetical protein
MDIYNYKYMKKPFIYEATGSGSSGRMKIPLVLAPQLWEKEPLEPFVKPVSDYVSAINAYDSYDGEMERSPQLINKNEKKAIDKAKRAKAMFSQSDDDGNPLNGYNPRGSDAPGTPEEIKKMAHIPKSEYEPVLKEDLGVWFGTKKKPKGSKQPKGPWVNICRKKEGGGHPPCGRPEADSKGYPKCRAAGVASKMSDSQKKSACAQKRKAEKSDPKVGTGNKPTMTSYKPKNESLRGLIRRILKEEYNPDLLYPVEQIYKMTSRAPYELKRVVKNLKPIACVNQNGEKKSCFKIPEVLYVYFSGRY